MVDVRAILEHPDGRPWVLQDIGLLGLRLDDARIFRLHVWDPDSCVVEPAIVHDHPFHFTSTVIAGAMTDTVYAESTTGTEYQRDRYVVSDESDRVTDTVRLVGASTTYVAGERYRHRAHELHSSAQVAGTVTLLRREHVEVDRLTVCRPAGSPWVSGHSRPAPAREVRRITAAALDLMA